MADDEDEEEVEEPRVELGDREPVEGAPIARVASRLTWPQERSRIRDKEGDATIRTPDGPRTLGSVLDGVDVSYFDSRQTFVDTVYGVVGGGPVQTESPERS